MTKLLKFKCTFCGNDTEAIRDPKMKNLFCSRECGFEWRRTIGSKTMKICDTCGKKFSSSHSTRAQNRFFCSKECFGNRKKVWPAKKDEYDREYKRKWHLRNRELVNRRAKEWGENNRERYLEIQREAQARRNNRLASSRKLSKEEEMSIKKFYNHKCLCCGKQEPEIALELDHVVAVSKGGTNDIWNRQPLCRICNARKSASEMDFRIMLMPETMIALVTSKGGDAQ